MPGGLPKIYFNFSFYNNFSFDMIFLYSLRIKMSLNHSSVEHHVDEKKKSIIDTGDTLPITSSMSELEILLRC